MSFLKTHLCVVLLGISTTALAANTATKTAPAQAGPVKTDDSMTGAERLNVENIKEKYWARGDESELGVVQNRQYSKTHKFELGVFGGFVTSDPFLNVKNAGFSLGYHFTEYLSLHVFGFKDFVGPSTALDFIRNPYPVGLGTDNSTNEPQWFFGSEFAASIIYGKLSLIGKAIIHYDLHFLAGAGMTSTESGKYFTPEVGLGQQFFLTKAVTLRLDYHLMRYNETILQKVVSPSSPAGTVLGDRVNYSNVITLGINFFIDPFSKKAPAESSNK